MALETLAVAARQQADRSDGSGNGAAWRNRWLAENLLQRLAEQGIMGFLNRQLPCNDSALSVGQAWTAMNRLNAGWPARPED